MEFPNLPSSGFFREYSVNRCLCRTSKSVVYICSKGDSRPMWPRRNLVVLKGSTDAMLVERIMAETEVSHTNVVHVSRVWRDSDSGLNWLEMPYRAGQTLACKLRDSRYSPKRLRTLNLLRGIASGVAYLHRLGIVHGDLKPGNVIIYHTDTPVIIDFSCSRFLDFGEEDWCVGGTLEFMPPECLETVVCRQMLPQTSPAADVYSFGLIAFALVTGRLPFAAADARGRLFRQRDVSSFRNEIASTPAYLRPTLKCCLAPNAVDRPSADDVYKSLGLTQDSDCKVTIDIESLRCLNDA